MLFVGLAMYYSIHKSEGIQDAKVSGMKIHACMIIMVFFCPVVHSKSSKDMDDWTWLYHKIFTEQEVLNNSSKQEMQFTQVDLPCFSQLIFSWNAHRPSLGYFRFLVQVRNAHTKTWGKWHRMMDWGSGIQRSYLSKIDTLSEYVHVRLEVPSCAADGFRIKILGNQADMSLLRSCSVCLSNFSLFKPEHVSSLHKKLPSVCIKGVPRQAQLALDHHKKESLCSPTSCSMVLGYLLNTFIEPTEFAEMSFDHGLNVHGSWPFNMAHAFERSNGLLHFATARSPSFTSLYRTLTQGIPVIVSVRGPLQGAAFPYSSGHLLVVIGWDKKNQEVICHDPACVENDAVEKRYPLESFLRAWERSHRLVYLAQPAIKQS